MNTYKLEFNFLKFLGGIILVAIIMLILISYCCPLTSDILARRIVISINNLNPCEEGFIKELIQNGKLYTIDNVTVRMISFYENLITYLLGLGVLSGLIGFFYIRHFHKRDICEEFEKDEVKKDIRKQLEEIFESKLSDEEINFKNSVIDELTSRIEFLENLLNNDEVPVSGVIKINEATSKRKNAKTTTGKVKNGCNIKK